MAEFRKSGGDSGEERPSKRLKRDGDDRDRNSGGRKKAGKWKGQSSNRTTARDGDGLFASDGIRAGDVGVFVSCDRGCEKKSLRELYDLIMQDFGDEFENRDSIRTEKNGDVEKAASPREGDIEAEIQAELDSMKPGPTQNGHSNNTTTTSGPTLQKTEKISLITLDIPCVSFLRLPSAADPVQLVLKLCEQAYNNPDRPRSRFIKRLTPVSSVRKVLNNGLDALCELILPKHFRVGETSDSAVKPCKFALRPTIRNNNKVSRTAVIDSVAGKVTSLGEHKVDLTGYDKLVLVDIYQNVCGMAVVGNDFERLKRYNIAEIYAANRTGGDADQKKEEN